jgi:hypothetical protein
LEAVNNGGNGRWGILKRADVETKLGLRKKRFVLGFAFERHFKRIIRGGGIRRSC